MAKRSARGSGMIRQRSDGRWEARYTVGRDPGTGKQVQKSIYGKTQNEVRKKLAEIIKDLDDGIYTDAAGLTVGKWLDTWHEEYTLNLKNTTRASYADIIRLHIKPGIGAVKLDKLTPTTIQKFYNSLMKGTKDKQPLSANSVRNVHTVLHKALRQATHPPRCLIKTNPADYVDLPKAEQKEMRVLTPDEISKLLEVLKHDSHYTMFYIEIFTGLRRGELLALQWSDIDFEKQSITVSKQVQRERGVEHGELRLVPLKNSKPRTIYPPASIFPVLETYRLFQDAYKRSAAYEGIEWQNPDAVFTNDRGGWLDGSVLYNTLQRNLVKAGLPRMRFHDLRHTFATTAIAEGVDVKTIQESLGHHDPGFTLRVYGHAHDEMKKAAADKLEALAEQIKPELPY